MTREKAKQLLPVIQAIINGQKIQVNINNRWQDVDENHNCAFLPESYEYRIKPESKYRPFKNAEECWQEMQKHQPFGWVKNIEFEKYFLIDEVTSIFSDAQIHISAYEGKNWNSFSTVFYNNTFADGTPFGIREC